MIPHQLVILVQAKLHQLSNTGECQVPPVSNSHIILTVNEFDPIKLETITNELFEKVKEWLSSKSQSRLEANPTETTLQRDANT
jgi:hypothetical protein